MKNLALTFILILFIAPLFAQDLFLTVRATFNNETISVDSIVINDLNNGLQIGFGSLSEREDYRINLSKKLFWGSTGIQSNEQSGNYTVLSNQRGLLSMACCNVVGNVQVSVYTLNGQYVTGSSILTGIGSKAIHVSINRPGIFLVRFNSLNESVTCKVFGQKGSGLITLSESGTPINDEALKSVALQEDEDSNFRVGDSLLVTVYKKAYLPDSVSFVLKGSCTQNFSLTPIAPPEVSTLGSGNVSDTSAMLTGQLLANGGDEIVEQGFFWSDTLVALSEFSNRIQAQTDTSAVFTANLTGLKDQTPYYFVAYARNHYKTGYGSIMDFKTKEAVSGKLIDIRDGKRYSTVKIGNQWWMAENLAYLPAVSPSAIVSDTSALFYVYDYQGINTDSAKSTANFTKYGVLYNWPAAMNKTTASDFNPSNVQGVCPANWHLPSEAEWNQLQNFLIENGYNYDGSTTGNLMAKSLCDTTLWKSSTVVGTPGNELYTNNATGFSAVPGGYLIDWTHNFSSLGTYTYWWTTSEISDKLGLSARIYYNSKDVKSSVDTKSAANSVRCVLNTEQEGEPPVIETKSITEITIATAMAEMEIADIENSSLINWGVCWNKTGNPTIDDQKTVEYYDGKSKRTMLTALEPTMKYYARIYAIHGHNVVYGKIIEFETPGIQFGSFVDSRDNHQYPTIVIGDQTWMAENLYWLPSVSPQTEGTSYTSNYYVYGYNGKNVDAAKSTSNYKQYGVLYNYQAAYYACPAGWHLPSDQEWMKLETAIGMKPRAAIESGYRGTNEGAKLKTKTGWGRQTNGNGTDTYGFGAKPTGLRHSNDKQFEHINGWASWWTSSWTESSFSSYRYLYLDEDRIWRGSYPFTAGQGVRCVKD